MKPAEIVERAVADYAGWGPTPAWPTLGGWVMAMLESDHFVIMQDFVIMQGDNISQPVGPFPSHEAAEDYYCANQPSGKRYLSKPRIIRLLRPAVSLPVEEQQ